MWSHSDGSHRESQVEHPASWPEDPALSRCATPTSVLDLHAAVVHARAPGVLPFYSRVPSCSCLNNIARGRRPSLVGPYRARRSPRKLVALYRAHPRSLWQSVPPAHRPQVVGRGGGQSRVSAAPFWSDAFSREWASSRWPLLAQSCAAVPTRGARPWAGCTPATERDFHCAQDEDACLRGRSRT